VHTKVKSKVIYEDCCPWKELCFTGTFFFARNLKLCLEIKAGQVIRLVHQKELGCHTRNVEAIVLISKASRRVLLFTQPPVCGHRASSPVGHEAYLSVPRLRCVKLYLHLATRVLALCLTEDTSIVFPISCVFSYGKYLGLVFPQHVTLYLGLYHVCPLL